MMASTLNILGHTDRTAPLCTPASADTPTTCLPLHSHQASVHDVHRSGLTEDGYVGTFECKICLDVCRDPVATLCGHIFCWPCLYYWLSLHSSSSKECPVCKADVQHKIVPLYGCGNAAYSTDSLAEKFHGMRIPCRPVAMTSIIQHSERHRVSARHSRSARYTTAAHHLGFCVALVRIGFACLPPLYLLRYGVRNAAASILLRQRRFNSKREFVLHWGFIILIACVAISFFLLRQKEPRSMVLQSIDLAGI